MSSSSDVFHSCNLRSLLLGPPLCKRDDTMDKWHEDVDRSLCAIRSQLNATYGKPAGDEILSNMECLKQFTVSNTAYFDAAKLSLLFLAIHMEPELRSRVTALDEAGLRLAKQTLPMCAQEYVDDFCQRPERMVALTAHVWLAWSNEIKSQDGVPGVLNFVRDTPPFAGRQHKERSTIEKKRKA